MLKKEIEEKKLKGNPYDNARDLRSKFDANQNNTRSQNDVGKHPDKMVTSSPSPCPARKVNLMKQRPTLRYYPQMYSASHSQ